jgi:hypothetical protein
LKLLIERLPIENAPAQELRPFRYDGEGVGFFWQQTPELGMVPAELMARAVSVSTYSLT